MKFNVKLILPIAFLGLVGMAEIAVSAGKPAFTISGCNQYITAAQQGNAVVYRFPIDTAHKKFKKVRVAIKLGQQTLSIVCTATSIGTRLQ